MLSDSLSLSKSTISLISSLNSDVFMHRILLWSSDLESLKSCKPLWSSSMTEFKVSSHQKFTFMQEILLLLQLLSPQLLTWLLISPSETWRLLSKLTSRISTWKTGSSQLDKSPTLTSFNLLRLGIHSYFQFLLTLLTMWSEQMELNLESLQLSKTFLTLTFRLCTSSSTKAILKDH